MKWIESIPAVLILALAGAVWLAPAQAAPTEHPADIIWLAWDAPSSDLHWVPGSSATAMGSFLGPSVIVPGDRLERTLLVRNDGPSQAWATVRITHPTHSAAIHELESLVHLTWQVNGVSHDMTWQELLESDDAAVATQFPVGQGDKFAVKAGLYFPIEATGGNQTGNASHTLSFVVEISLSEYGPGDPPPPTPPPGPGTQTGGAVSQLADVRLAVGLVGVASLVWLVWLWRRRGQSNIG